MTSVNISKLTSIKTDVSNFFKNHKKIAYGLAAVAALGVLATVVLAATTCLKGKSIGKLTPEIGKWTLVGTGSATGLVGAVIFIKKIKKKLKDRKIAPKPIPAPVAPETPESPIAKPKSPIQDNSANSNPTPDSAPTPEPTPTPVSVVVAQPIVQIKDSNYQTVCHFIVPDYTTRISVDLGIPSPDSTLMHIFRAFARNMHPKSEVVDETQVVLASSRQAENNIPDLHSLIFIPQTLTPTAEAILHRKGLNPDFYASETEFPVVLAKKQPQANTRHSTEAEIISFVCAFLSQNIKPKVENVRFNGTVREEQMFFLDPRLGEQLKSRFIGADRLHMVEQELPTQEECREVPVDPIKYSIAQMCALIDAIRLNKLNAIQPAHNSMRNKAEYDFRSILGESGLSSRRVNDILARL